MLFGILVLVSVSVIIGSAVGWYATGKTVAQLKQEQIYDTSYTDGKVGESEDVTELFDDKSANAIGSAAC